MDQGEAERLMRSGWAALRSGRADEARRAFEAVIGALGPTGQLLLLHGEACLALEDWEALGQTADRLLSADRSNVRALLYKGDALAGAGDDRGAAAFWRSAASVDRSGLSADLIDAVGRAGVRASALADRFGDHLERSLERSGSGRRIAQAIDLLAGRKEIYLQQPQQFYLPELPQRQFYDREEFEWAAGIEAAAAVIAAELKAMIAERGTGPDGGFRPYMKTDTARPQSDSHGLLDNEDWSTLHLFEDGRPVADAVERCPRTWAAIESLPLCRIGPRAPSVLFSLLRGGARIPPHHGMINARLICHLPLQAPAGCGFRVGNEVREWEAGKLLIFDDTIEHEAWNDSGQDRIVLIFDVWKPEVTEAERAAIVALFEAVDAYQPERGAGVLGR